MKLNQIEMEFSTAPRRRPGCRRPRRLTRARWWFGQMRQAVDRALEWQSPSPGRPQQESLGFSAR